MEKEFIRGNFPIVLWVYNSALSNWGGWPIWGSDRFRVFVAGFGRGKGEVGKREGKRGNFIVRGIVCFFLDVSGVIKFMMFIMDRDYN